MSVYVVITTGSDVYSPDSGAVVLGSIAIGCLFFTQASLIRSDTFSAAIMMTDVGLQFGNVGKILVSTTLMFLIPCTLSWLSTTVILSSIGPILVVPPW